MKNLLLVLVLIFFAGTLFAQVAILPAGDGSPGNPYQIAMVDNLYWITQNSSSWGSYFIQTADINVSGSSGWDGGAGFTPIGTNFYTTAFTGSYDGQTFKITGLCINRTSTSEIGMFGCVMDPATITNVKLENVNINGYQEVGGLIGRQQSAVGNSCTVTNCYVTGSVTCQTYYVGGLIGYQKNSSVSKCYAAVSVSVSGSGNGGGMIGLQLADAGGGTASCTNCYSTGTVSGDVDNSYQVGGLLGIQTGTADAGAGGGTAICTNCYSTGAVTGKGSVGGLIGRQDVATSTTTNCFWDNVTSGQTTGVGDGFGYTGITGKTTTDMKTQSTFLSAGWSGATWNIGDGINNGYPYLRWQNPSGTPLPVELTSFTVTTSNSNATLLWKTATELNNFGFEIERRAVNSEVSNVKSWGKIGFVQSAGTSNSPKEYSYTDASVSYGTYAYRLKQIDNSGAFKYSQEAEVTIEAPKVFALSQNYPDPFNPSTTISFSLPSKSFVSLKVHDALGREVSTILSEELSAGTYSRQWNGAGLPSGVYFYRIQAGTFTETKKLVLLR